MGWRSSVLIIILVFSTLFLILYASESLRLTSPIPKLTENQATEVMKADIQERVGNVTVRIYPMDHPLFGDALPLLYYRQADNMVFRINETSGAVMASCSASLDCFLNNKQDVLESIDGRLFYFLDGSYSGKHMNSPAYYYIDAINGDVLWSYIGEDIYPELHQSRISQEDAIRIAEVDLKVRLDDFHGITKIIVNNTSDYVPFDEFEEKNLELPLVWVNSNDTLLRVTQDGHENMGQCDSGLTAYCGYLPPFDFSYRGKLVYGVEVVASYNEDYGVPFLYIIDAVTGDIVDSTFLRDEKIHEGVCGEPIESVKSVAPFTVLLPTNLPKGYSLQSVDYVPNVTVIMQYFTRSLCDPNNPYSPEEGVIEIVEAPLSQVSNAKSGREYVQTEMEKYGSVGINATSYVFRDGRMNAVGYEAGKGTTKAIDENGTIVQETEFEYSAHLWVVDDKTGTIVKIEARSSEIPLEQLALIAESLND